MKRASDGFTLIELMIVVAIIAILAAIAVPVYQEYVIRSQVSEGSVLADGVMTAIAEFQSSKGRLPPSNFSAGLAQPTSIRGNYVASLAVSNVANSTIVVTYGNQSNAAITSKVLAFSASTLPGSVVWHCSQATTTLNTRYLPQLCRP